MIKIAIADDDTILLETFKVFFEEELHIHCAYIASDLQDLLELLPNKRHIDYLFLDIDFGGISSLEYIAQIKKIKPQTEIIMFSQNTTDENLFKAICAGASGFLPKSVKLPELKDYIKILLQGGAAITPQLAKRLINHFQPPAVFERDGKTKILSELDMQVLKLLATGYSYQQIADTINISINAVRYHIKKIYKTLHVNNKVAAIRLYQEGKI